MIDLCLLQRAPGFIRASLLSLLIFTFLFEVCAPVQEAQGEGGHLSGR